MYSQLTINHTEDTGGVDVPCPGRTGPTERFSRVAERIDALVVGAGVIGLTSAVLLAEQGLKVQVRAGRPPGRTTSAVAGALVGGPLTTDAAEAAAKFAPVDTSTGWQRASLREFTALAQQPGTGVHTARGRLVCAKAGGDLDLPGYRPCPPKDSAGFAVAFWSRMPIVDMPAYLDYLAARAAAAGATVTTGQVPSLQAAAAAAPIVVNCTGTGAAALVPDPAVVPVRGQHVVVDNPGLSEFFFENNAGPTSTSYFPHGARLVLGGTSQRGADSLEPDPDQTREIIERCTAVEPRIAGAKVLDVQVGLRAARPRTRLEAERIDGSLVIHNYGHGGIAVGLSWGCARQVLRLAGVDDALEPAARPS